MATHTFKQGKISEYRSESPCLPAGDLPDPGIEPAAPASPPLQANSLPSEPPGKPD